ncbi:hypothetical protein KJ567_05980, partial [Candidatus Bipolaricaulota bacterium]|nr:hypothetical protein [Candidatus Bipolaricaulota bacterium]
MPGKDVSLRQQLRNAFKKREIQVGLLSGVFAAAYFTADSAVLGWFFTKDFGGSESYLLAGSLVGLVVTLILGALHGRAADTDFATELTGASFKHFLARMLLLLRSLFPDSSSDPVRPRKHPGQGLSEMVRSSFHKWRCLAVLTGLAGAAFTHFTLEAIGSPKIGLIGFLPSVQLSIVYVFFLEWAFQRCGEWRRSRADHVKMTKKPWVPFRKAVPLQLLLLLAATATVLRSLDLSSMKELLSFLPLLFGGVAGTNALYSLAKNRGMAAGIDAVTFRFVSFFWTAAFIFLDVLVLRTKGIGCGQRWEWVFRPPAWKFLIVVGSMSLVFYAFTREYRARKSNEVGGQLTAWSVNALVSVQVALGAVFQFGWWMAVRHGLVRFFY